MPYVVINNFKDAEDGKREYSAGEQFPREGLNVSEERFAELSSEDNKAKKVLIEKVAESETGDETFPKHKGGGNYILSNGESVKGKEDAQKAEDALKSGE